MKKILHEWPITVMFIILTVGFGLVASRQQINFNDHKRIDENVARKVCFVLQSRWDVVDEIIRIEKPQDGDLTKLVKLNGTRPVCEDT